MPAKNLFPGLALIVSLAAVTVLDIVEGADMPPTSQVVAKAGEIEQGLRRLLQKWEAAQSLRRSMTRR